MGYLVKLLQLPFLLRSQVRNGDFSLASKTCPLLKLAGIFVFAGKSEIPMEKLLSVWHTEKVTLDEISDVIFQAYSQVLQIITKQSSIFM